MSIHSLTRGMFDLILNTNSFSLFPAQYETNRFLIEMAHLLVITSAPIISYIRIYGREPLPVLS
ncbi:hypothetical protein K439DRAFT_1638379 [Ramaria rubella]|nr:hypothetical protein K439DRAFT_1638379 [Ramaria rubella]